MSREFDVIVYGATGFVGGLTARYLAEHAPAGTRIALAGRSETKLAGIRRALPDTAANWPLVVADSDSPVSLDAMCARTQVVCTTVGPYLRYGENLVVAAATAGTDYVDLTGEVPFSRFTIDKTDELARSTGARIVNSCGFDSVPSDLGVYLLYRTAAEEGAGALGETTMVVASMRGGVSGGTVDSMRVIAEQSGDQETRKLLMNPRALSGGPGDTPQAGPRDEPSDIAPVSASTVDPSLRGTLAPFFMSSYNTRVVRRSDVLLSPDSLHGGAYGPDFRYRETMAVGGVPVLSSLIAGAVAVGTGIGLGLMGFAPTRRLLDRVLPTPGEGPSETARKAGHFTTHTYTKTASGRRFRSQIRAQGDPGYQATAVMLGEAALALAVDRDKLPDRAGALTPAAAMGDALIARLQGAGFVLDVVELS